MKAHLYLILLLLASFALIPELKAQGSWIEQTVLPDMAGAQLTTIGFDCIISTRVNSRYVFFFDIHSKVWTVCDLGSQQNIKVVKAGKHVVFAYTDSLLIAYSSVTSTFHVKKYSGNILQSTLPTMQGYGCGDLAAYAWTDENIVYVYDGLAGVWKNYNYGETTNASGGRNFWCGDNYVAGIFHRKDAKKHPNKHRNIVYSLVAGSFNKTETGGGYLDAMTGGFVSAITFTPDTALFAGYSAATNQFYVITEETPYAYVNIGSWENKHLRKKNVYGYNVNRRTVEPKEATIRTFDTQKAAWITHSFTYSGYGLNGSSGYRMGGNTAICATEDPSANATFYVYSGETGAYSIIQPGIENLNLSYYNVGANLAVALGHNSNAWFFNSQTKFSQLVSLVDGDFTNYAVSSDYISFCRYEPASSIMNIWFYNSLTDRASKVGASKYIFPLFEFTPYTYVFVPPSSDNQVIFYSSIHDSIMSVTSDLAGANSVLYAAGVFSWIKNMNNSTSSLIFDAANLKLLEVDAILLSNFVSDSMILFRKGNISEVYDASTEKFTSVDLGSVPGSSTHGGNIILVGNANYSKFYAFQKGSTEWIELIPEGNAMAAYASMNTAAVVRNTKVYAFMPDDKPTYTKPITDLQKSIFFQNSPNPFSQNTSIIWKTTEPGHVHLKVYDLMGREVRTLIDKHQAPGEHQVTFYAEGFPTGVYFVRLHFNNQCISKKMIKL